MLLWLRLPFYQKIFMKCFSHIADVCEVLHQSPAISGPDIPLTLIPKANETIRHRRLVLTNQYLNLNNTTYCDRENIGASIAHSQRTCTLQDNAGGAILLENMPMRRQRSVLVCGESIALRQTRRVSLLVCKARTRRKVHT